MNTISSYVKNEAKSTTLGTKRRLRSEELTCDSRKRRAFSIDNRRYDVGVNENFTNVEDSPSTSGAAGRNKHDENDQQNSQLNNSDCFNEDVFVRELAKSFSPTADFSALAQLLLSGNFNQLQPSTTQMISNLSSQPYLGLIEKDKLMLLLEFLIKLHNCNTGLPTFQEKSKIWAITQLKKSFCLPPSYLFAKEYLHPVTVQTAIIKVVGIIANEKHVERHIPNEIIHILSGVSLVALKMAILPPPSFVESILKILHERKSTLPISQELLEHINMLIIEDKININSESLAYLWSLQPSSLEDIVVDLLVESKTQSNRRKTMLKLVQACHHDSVLFQQVVNIFTTAWLQTGGESSIADSLSQFVCLVQNVSDNNSLLSLFPDDLSPLVLLLQISADDFPPDMQRLHAYSVIEMLSEMVSSGLCQMKDAIILFLIFPSWFHILHSLSTTEPFNSNDVLKMLVNAN